ncbi:glycosyltransferase [Enteroscipio rubneri]|uniref:glycosyltransferase n=1 Tax=Enteroscipio rubneri TaxID=2070686 RepID=UPI003AF18F89
MRFSIIVPFRNSESYIGRCIDSVCSQVYEDWELLLVDDASKDDSTRIGLCYAERFGSKVKLLSCPGKGPLFARRVGYAAAEGDVLISLDSDDMLRSDALERLSDAFREHEADIVIFGCSRKEDFSGDDFLKPFPATVYLSGTDKVECVRRLCTSPTLNSMCAKAVRRECIDLDADYSRWEGLKYAEDLLQSLSVIDAAKSIYFIEDQLYFYRVNYASSTKRFNPAQLEMRDAVNAVHREYAARWGVEFGDDTLVDSVLAMGLSSYGDMAQGACEDLSLSQARDFMEILMSREQLTLYWSPSALKSLRLDIRFIVSLLKAGHFGLIWAFSRVKAAARKCLGR